MREHARADAWLRKDKRALEALLAPDFIEINYFGRLSREGVLHQLFPSVTMRAFVIEDPQIHPAGNEAAVIMYRCHEEIIVKGEDITGTFHVAALYIWNGKQWQLSLWQITPWVSAGT